MIEVHVLIPVADNSGTLFSTVHHEAFEAMLRSEFGGCSLLPGLIAGQWTDASGNVYVDQTRDYFVALSSITEGGRVRTAAEFAKVHYQQLNIYIRYLGLSEIL